MRRKQFAARVWSKLVAFERAHAFLEKGGRVLAAVSGGADSVCLAHYLAQRSRALGFGLEFLHVHHGLRGKDADRDAESVRRLGRALGVRTTVARVPTRAVAGVRKMGLEDAGRVLRYRAFAASAKKLRCVKVATAHQQDDQAETVLLHLLRGTQLKGLGGIPPRRALAPGIDVIRPLLCLERREVLEYLKVHGLRHREDKSNLSTAFTRNWVRRKVIPLLESRSPRLKEHLAGLAAQVRDSGPRTSAPPGSPTRPRR